MISRTLATRAAVAVGGTALLVASLTGCSGGLGGSSSGGSTSDTSSSKLTGPVTIKLLAGGNDPVARHRQALRHRLPQGEPKDHRQGRHPPRRHRRRQPDQDASSPPATWTTSSSTTRARCSRRCTPTASSSRSPTSPGSKTSPTTSRPRSAPPRASTAPLGHDLRRRHPLQQEGLREARPARSRRRWDEFIATARRSRPRASPRSCSPYGDTWTSQLFVLGDFANVSAQDPKWADAVHGQRPEREVREPAGARGFDAHSRRSSTRRPDEQGLRVADQRERR